jgi:NhaA family Na+:H+ antiporter
VSTNGSAAPAARRATFIERDSALARLARPITQFLRIESAGGILMLTATVIALLWANSPWKESYEDLWSSAFNVTIGGFEFDHDLHAFVNDALMAVFFFVVGLEIKREMVVGELRDRRQVLLPAVAALGGMVVPALIFVAFNAGSDGSGGWGIPMATDIAFAVGVLTVLGSRVPTPLKVFLLTLAIADDLGAIAVIAIFYSDDVSPQFLLVAVAVAFVVGMLRRLHVTYPPVYIIGGIALWVAVYESGVHATIAGVVMGLLTPAVPMQSEIQTERLVDRLENRDSLTAEEVRVTAGAIKDSVSLCDRLVELLHPWTSYFIVPVFALSNAGVRLDANPLDERNVFLGVALGLVLGKTLGITLFSWLITRTPLAVLPKGVGWGHFVATAAVAGIGFTVALFITGLAFDDAALEAAAKVGILIASTLAALLGAGAFILLGRRRDDTADV